MILQDEYCEKCDEKYTNNDKVLHSSLLEYKWCESCQIDNLKKSFINWTSGNEIVDNYIQERQQNIGEPDNKIFEWIPYNQLNDIKEINSDLYSAIWKDGPLYFCFYKKEYLRKSENQKVILTYLYNSSNTNEFLEEV